MDSGGTREEAERYATVTAKPERRRAFSLSTQSAQGKAVCRFSPTGTRVFGCGPLRGDIVLSEKVIATVNIQNEMYAPLIRAESDRSEVLAEREPFRDPYAPVSFKGIRHGLLAEATRPEVTLSELWRSRFGFGRVRWGSLQRPSGLDVETEFVLQVVMSAYEFIWKPRHDSTDAIGS